MCQQEDSLHFLHSDGVLGIQVENLAYYTIHPRVYTVVEKIWDMLT
jgi:hypothetical protein